MNPTEARRLIDGAGNQFFTIVFTKKDNTERTMLCRRHVTRGVKGTGKSYKDIDHGLITVFDVNDDRLVKAGKAEKKGAFKSIRLDSILSVRYQQSCKSLVQA